MPGWYGSDGRACLACSWILWVGLCFKEEREHLFLREENNVEPQKTFTVDEFFALRQPTGRVPLHLSPDGASLLISVQGCSRDNDAGKDQSYTKEGIPREMVQSRVLMVDTTTGHAHDPLPATWTSWGAQWSPDDTRWVAYVCAQGQLGLGVWERVSGRYQFLGPLPIRPFFGFEVPCWTPDSQSVVVKLLATSSSDTSASVPTTVQQEASPARVFTFVPGKQEQEKQEPLPGWADGYLCDLARIDVASGAVQRLAERRRVIGWKVAPDGGAVAVFHYTACEPTLQQMYFDLTVLPLDARRAVSWPAIFLRSMASVFPGLLRVVGLPIQQGNVERAARWSSWQPMGRLILWF